MRPSKNAVHLTLLPSRCLATIAACLYFSALSARGDLLATSEIVGFQSGSLGFVGGSEGWFVIGNNSNITVTKEAGSLDGTALGLRPSLGDRVFINSTAQLAIYNQF